MKLPPEKEDLFMACLLVCGSDPDPDNGKPSEEYDRWCGEVTEFFRTHVPIGEIIVSRSEFYLWVYKKTGGTWDKKGQLLETLNTIKRKALSS